MKISAEQYEKLVRFIDLDMSVSEMKEFAEELDANPDLREQLYFEEQVRADMDTLYDPDTKTTSLPAGLTEAELREIHIEMEAYHVEESSDAEKEKQELATAKPATKARILKIDFSIAVAATLLIAVALVYLFNAGSTGHGTFVKNRDTVKIKKDDENMVKTPIDTTLTLPQKRSADIASVFSSFYKKDTIPKLKPDLYASALTDYNNGYYRTIQKIDAFNLPEIRGSENDLRNSKEYTATIGHYYTGLSLIETKDVTQAIRNLQWVKDSADDKSYVVKAQWYLSLAYLKNRNTDSAMQLLRNVSTNSNVISYQNKAKELLKKIE